MNTKPQAVELPPLIAQLREAEEALPMEGGRYCERVAKLCGQAAALLAADTQRAEARPLTEEQIADMARANYWHNSITTRACHREGVRDAEAAHGIKEQS